MKSSDSLFLLIKSMTKSEKRSFKINMDKYELAGDKLCPLLFDAIDAQYEYDEKAIKSKLKKQTPSFKQLAPVKIYLHKLILKNLRSFNDDSSCDMKLNRYLAEIEILHKRELFRDCANAIKKAKAYAEKYEKFSRLLDLIAWETKVAMQLNDISKLELLRRKSIEEEKTVLEKCDEITELKLLGLQVRSVVIVQGDGRGDEDKIFRRRILSNELLQNKSKSFLGELSRLRTVFYCAESDESYTALKNLITYIDIHPHQIDEHIVLYFNALLELANRSMLTEKFISTRQLIQKMNKIYDKNQHQLSLSNKIGLLRVETFLLLNQGEFAQALDIIPKINNIIEINYKELDPVSELFLYHLCFSVYSVNRDFKSAYDYIQKIMDYGDDIRIDIISAARIVNLILQFEQQQYEHLGYLLRTTYRYLMKKHRLYKPEIIILDFIKKALKITSAKQAVEALSELKEQILPHLNEPFAIGFPLIEWIDSKLQKRDLADIMRERYLSSITREQAENVTA